MRVLLFRLRPLLLAVMLLAGPGLLRSTVVTLHVPSAPVRAGSEAAAELIIVNPSGATVTYPVPGDVSAYLSDGTREWRATVRASGGGVAVAAGGFQRVPVSVILPPDAAGRLVLEMDQPAKLRAVIDVMPGAADSSGPTPADLAAAEIVRNSPETLPAANRVRRYYADHFSAHEPMYFLFGDEAPAAKFQISLKYRLLNDRGPLATWLPALRGLHVAYLQRSLWDITSVSSPFFDSSYMPELLFQSLADEVRTRNGFTWVGWQAAFQHESNGRDGAQSRSLNSIYFRPMMAFGDLDGWRLVLRPKVFAYVGDLGDNPEIKRYRGYSELRAILAFQNRFALSATGRLGSDGEKGALQLDASYPTEFLSGNFAMFLHLQYWIGYGESLLRYNARSESLRAGFSIAR